MPSLVNIPPRRAFSLSPLVVLLALAVIGLVAWKIGVNLSLIPDAHPHAPRLRGRVWSANILAILVALALSGGIGAMAYFVFGKSETAANAGMAPPLVLGVGLFSYQMYGFLTRDERPAGSYGVQTAQRHTPTAPAQQPVRPPPPLSSPPPSRVAGPPSPSPAPPGPAAGPRESAEVERVLDSIRSEVRADAAALADAAAAMLDAAATVPRPVEADLEARRLQAEKVKTGADALRTRLFEIREEAQRRLERAGLPTSEATAASIRFASRASSAAQSSAMFRLSNTADFVLDEVKLLTNALGKWSLKSGEVDTRDPHLQVRIRGPRFQIEHAMKVRDELIKPLRGEN